MTAKGAWERNPRNQDGRGCGPARGGWGRREAERPAWMRKKREGEEVTEQWPRAPEPWPRPESLKGGHTSAPCALYCDGRTTLVSATDASTPQRCSSETWSLSPELSTHTPGPSFCL